MKHSATFFLPHKRFATPTGISLDVMGTLIRPRQSTGTVYHAFCREYFTKNTQINSHKNSSNRQQQQEEILSLSAGKLDERFLIGYRAARKQWKINPTEKEEVDNFWKFIV